MKTIVVLTFDLPAPENVVDVLTALDPPKLPYFAGEARVAVGEDAEHVENWLDE